MRQIQLQEVLEPKIYPFRLFKSYIGLSPASWVDIAIQGSIRELETRK
jgi:hypothetical protein